MFTCTQAPTVFYAAAFSQQSEFECGIHTSTCSEEQKRKDTCIHTWVDMNGCTHILSTTLAHRATFRRHLLNQ